MTLACPSRPTSHPFRGGIDVRRDAEPSSTRSPDAAVRQADWSTPEAAKAAVSERMRDYLPTETLLFLMELSIEPSARRLGLLE